MGRPVDWTPTRADGTGERKVTMQGDWKLAEEARQDMLVADADDMARFLDGIERDVQRAARRRRLDAKAKRVRH